MAQTRKCKDSYMLGLAYPSSIEALGHGNARPLGDLLLNEDTHVQIAAATAVSAMCGGPYDKMQTCLAKVPSIMQGLVKMTCRRQFTLPPYECTIGRRVRLRVVFSSPIPCFHASTRPTRWRRWRGRDNSLGLHPRPEHSIPPPRCCAFLQGVGGFIYTYMYMYVHTYISVYIERFTYIYMYTYVCDSAYI